VARAGGNIRRLKFVHIEEALRLAEEEQEGRQLSLPGVALEVRSEDLILGPPNLHPRPLEEFIVPLGGRVEATSLGVIVESAVVPPETTHLDDGAAYLDADRVGSTIKLRAWRSGDRFRPLGMQGKKKVGNFFTDAKTPRLERFRIPVVEAEDGTIVWVVGWRVSEDARVTPQTRRVLRLRAVSKPRP
jgi:tRNA(Ile)-lysidine synthase